jgi:hypothetical protein
VAVLSDGLVLVAGMLAILMITQIRTRQTRKFGHPGEHFPGPGQAEKVAAVHRATAAVPVGVFLYGIVFLVLGGVSAFLSIPAVFLGNNLVLCLVALILGLALAGVGEGLRRGQRWALVITLTAGISAFVLGLAIDVVVVVGLLTVGAKGSDLLLNLLAMVGLPGVPLVLFLTLLLATRKRGHRLSQ